MKHTVYEKKLSTGAKGLVVHVPGASVVNILFRFNSGFQFSDFSKYELPHVMEHLIGCGSAKYPKPGDFKIEVEKNGAMRNAYTSSAVNGYIAECAAFETERILDLFEEYLTAPVFPEEAFATEISNVREELNRNTTEYGSVCVINLLAAAYPKEYMTYEPRIEQLDSITRDDVVAYYERTHRAENMRFYISGDFADEGDRIVARVEQLSKRLPKGTRFEIADTKSLKIPKPIVQEEEIKQIYYRVGMHSAGTLVAERPILGLLRTILFGGYRSRVFGKARELGLAYQIGGNVGSSDNETTFTIMGYVTSTNSLKLFELVAAEIQDILDHGISEDELSQVKDLVIGSITRNYQTPSDILSWYISDYDEDETIYDFDTHLDRIKLVTSDQITDIARRVFRDSNTISAFVGPISEHEATRLNKTLSF